MDKQILPSPQTLRELIEYDPCTGLFRWKPRGLDLFQTKRAFSVWNKRFSGKQAFATANSHTGYLCGVVNYKLIMSHRAAWAITHDEWPSDDIDHVNGDKTDNRIANLRKATRSQNNCNSGTRKDNTSGYRGVSFHKQYGKWESRIHVDKVKHHLGYFSTAEDAANAYKIASVEMHKEFSRIEI